MNNINLNNYLFFILIILLSCKKGETKSITNALQGNKKSIAYSKVTKGLSQGDEILWSNENVNIYVNHLIIEEGEEKLIIYTNKGDTLLTFNHDEGGRITNPFLLNKSDDTFVNFFEVWEGSGFLSKKNFYKLNTKQYKLERVIDLDFSTLLKKVKAKFNITDSLYTRKGEFYNNYLFDKTCFNENVSCHFH